MTFILTSCIITMEIEMDHLTLDEHSRQILRLFLADRERPYKISYQRWNEITFASTKKIMHDELAEVLDLYGYHLLEMLMLPIDAKISLIHSMKFQVEKDGGYVPSTDVRHILDIDRIRRNINEEQIR